MLNSLASRDLPRGQLSESPAAELRRLIDDETAVAQHRREDEHHRD